jgi:uncharacterized SAM-binding protein YcdF (DUF218 family)
VPGDAFVRFDALVLLGCRVAAGALPPPAARRVTRTAEAFALGLAPRVVVSGGRRWEERVEADRLAEELCRRGVPREALLLERRSRNTRENALLTAGLLTPLRLASVGIVTCDWHLPRALWSFRHEGFAAEGVPAQAPPVAAVGRASRFLREQGAWLSDRVRAALW